MGGTNVHHQGSGAVKGGHSARGENEPQLSLREKSPSPGKQAGLFVSRLSFSRHFLRRPEALKLFWSIYFIGEDKKKKLKCL